MRLRIRAVWVMALLGAAGGVFAQVSLSGTAETSFFAAAGAGASPGFMYGAEEYANLRLQIPAGEYAVFYGAFNLTASAGSYPAAAGMTAAANAGANATGGLLSGSSVYGENYAAAIELERLYLQLSSDTLGLQAGLLRVPLGFGLAWGPMDFLNPRNPLKPDARLRAVLGTNASWYPLGDIKCFAFAAAPRDPLALEGGGSRFGLGWENHWSAASLQLLACYESPAFYAVPFPLKGAEYPQGLYRFGLSLKGDLELGLVTELIHTLNPASPELLPGLSASAGFDYTFLDGRLYALAEYLYSGAESVSAAGPANPLGRRNRHYLYVALTWFWSDFTSLTLGSGICLDDPSAAAALTWKHEPLQGLTVDLEFGLPLDGESFGGNAGELGPVMTGYRFSFTAGLTVKF
ncbi:MAG: hypothetical protein LBQ44_00905 [Treponema sp.]|jgi:hypothetical protein|nr:hypothetical protein [Treponema sp.]